MQDFIHESKYKCKDSFLLNMPCALTSKQYRTYRFDKNGERVPTLRYERYRKTPIVVRCNKCDGCRRLQNDTWFLRMYHEFLGHPNSKLVFITLTFNEDEYRYIESHLKDMPKDQWHKDDYTPVYRYYIVPFKKRLRASEKLQFSFYCVSERGERNGRYHFHLVLFWHNWKDFQNIADAWNISHPFSLHYVRSKRSPNGLRLQTSLEGYLQHIVERQFSRERHSSLSDRYIFERKGKSRRISSKGSYGNVTLFIADGVGMLRYVTNYVSKCQHDGSDTYHRQTPGLGKKFVAENLKDLLFDDNLPLCCCGKNSKGNLLFLPTPRIYFRWFGDKDKLIIRFWKTNKDAVSNWLSEHGSPSINDFG